MIRSLRWLRAASWLAVAAWAGTIIYLSSLSGSDLEHMMTVQIWDKLAHFSAFAAGSALLTGALRVSTAWPPLRIALLAIFTLALFGATDEWHQLYTPGRSGADRYDWIADVLGATTAACATTVLLYARHSRKNRPAPVGN